MGVWGKCAVTAETGENKLSSQTSVVSLNMGLILEHFILS